jgi:chromate transport protein ChrA
MLIQVIEQRRKNLGDLDAARAGFASREIRTMPMKSLWVLLLCGLLGWRILCIGRCGARQRETQ